MTTKIGTLRNIPAIPQIFPKIPRDIIIIIGLKLRDLPISLGSMKFPIKSCTNIKETIVNTEIEKSNDWTIEKITGKTIAINEPMKGIKFNKKEKIPNKTARLLDSAKRIKKVRVPVKKLVNILISKYS